MKIAINTDLQSSLNSSPVTRELLAIIRDAGFESIHWCHDWNKEKLYSRDEIAQIKRWLVESNLSISWIHGTDEPNWVSENEKIRQRGVEAVQNRIYMAAELGTDVVVLHIHPLTKFSQLSKSLHQLEKVLERFEVKIALENLENYENNKFANHGIIEQALKRFPSLGVCFDSGHANMIKDGIPFFERVKDRVIAAHFHDNYGQDDHLLPFCGNIDWPNIVSILAQSPCKDMCLEVNMQNHPDKKIGKKEFISLAFAAGKKLIELIP